MEPEEKKVIDEFEGKESYEKHLQMQSIIFTIREIHYNSWKIRMWFDELAAVHS